MSREDVIFGSNVGNTTNPQFLEVDNWVKYGFLHLLTIPMFLGLTTNIRVLDYHSVMPFIDYFTRI